MKTLRLPSIVLLSILFIGAYSELKNNFSNDKPGFKIGPDEQRIVINLLDVATFDIIDLDGAKSVRIEARSLGIIGSWITIIGFGNITTEGTYYKNTEEIHSILGIGIFLWRIVDNQNSNHISDTKLIIIIL